MGALIGSSQRSKIRQVLEDADGALDQQEIAKKAELTEEETRETLGKMVDRGEARTTLDWEYILTE